MQLTLPLLVRVRTLFAAGASVEEVYDLLLAPARAESPQSAGPETLARDATDQSARPSTSAESGRAESEPAEVDPGESGPGESGPGESGPASPDAGSDLRDQIAAAVTQISTLQNGDQDVGQGMKGGTGGSRRGESAPSRTRA